MKVIEHLANATKPLVSVEIIPPRRGGNVERIYEAVSSLLPYEPPFIDITSHAGETVWDEVPGGTFRRRVTRKAPGTFGLCAAIKYRFDIDPVPHVLCNGFTREETEDALIELNYLGIENVLAIRGDGERRAPAEGRSANEGALELVGQVAAMNRGEYLEELVGVHADGLLHRGRGLSRRSTRRRRTSSGTSRCCSRSSRPAPSTP